MTDGVGSQTAFAASTRIKTHEDWKEQTLVGWGTSRMSGY